VVAISASRERPLVGRLPRTEADIASTVPRAIEWPAGAKPSWRTKTAASAGIAHVTARARKPPADLDLTASITA